MKTYLPIRHHTQIEQAFKTIQEDCFGHWNCKPTIELIRNDEESLLEVVIDHPDVQAKHEAADIAMAYAFGAIRMCNHLNTKHS